MGPSENGSSNTRGLNINMRCNKDGAAQAAAMYTASDNYPTLLLADGGNRGHKLATALNIEGHGAGTITAFCRK